jgi:hypothetical protein
MPYTQAFQRCINHSILKPVTIFLYLSTIYIIHMRNINFLKNCSKNFRFLNGFGMPCSQAFQRYAIYSILKTVTFCLYLNTIYYSTYVLYFISQKLFQGFSIFQRIWNTLLSGFPTACHSFDSEDCNYFYLSLKIQLLPIFNNRYIDKY